MSIVSIRAALETALNAMSPALATAWENQAFTPTAGTPYQAPVLLVGDSQDPVSGDLHREVGIFHIRLFYPIQAGTGAIAARAELIRTTFAKSSSFTSGTVTVRILSTPSITSGGIDGDRYMIAVKIPYQADI